jgi:hypothetical protein
MQIEPETKIVQADFGSQTSLKAGQIMGTLTRQAKGIQEFVVDRFDDLPDTGQPTAQRFGPANALAALMWGSHQLDVSLCMPPLTWPLSGKAFVGYIGSLSRQATTGQTCRRSLANREQGLGQVLIMGADRPKAKTSNHSQGGDTQQQMKAFVPAEAIAPTDIGLPSQPASAAAFGIASHGRGTIQDLIAALLGLQQADQKQAERRDRIVRLAQESIELTASRQRRKRGSQVMLSIAVKGPFAGKLHPLAKERQGDHLTAVQGGLWSWGMFALGNMRLAKIIGHDVQCCQEGIQIDHQRAPFLTNWFVQLTVISGYLAFQLLSISHQTFKEEAL